jgi:hypothetical protein
MKRMAYLVAILVVIAATDIMAAWTTPFQINQLTYHLQATRDSDTPRAMALDASGNIHLVFETQADTNSTLGIHYRKRNLNNSWGNEISITASEPLRSDPSYEHQAYGHPSIIFNADLRGLICYLMDNGSGSQHRETRSRDVDFNQAYPFGDFRFMSEEGWPYLISFGSSSLKVPVMAIDYNSNIYGFWPYRDTINGSGYIQLYWRKYAIGDGWLNNEEILPAIPYQYHGINTIDALADPAGDIHVVFSMTEQPSDASIEVYHCWYDVSTQTWSDLDSVSAPSGPDGHNSILPYLAFSGTPGGYQMYVVWEEDYMADRAVKIRRYSKYTDSWDTDIVVKSPSAIKPTVTTLTNGDIYVAWADTGAYGQWIYYKYRNHETGNWSNAEQVDVGEAAKSPQDCPFIISDRWDNLHISFIGYSPNADTSDWYETYYSFNDLPPLAPINMAVLPDTLHPKFKWSPCTEPSFSHYVICKSQNRQGPWSYEAQTTDTIYKDVSVILNSKDKKVLYYCVKTVDNLTQESPLSLALGFHYIYDWGGKLAGEILPDEYLTVSNYPNPFNAQTIIKYNLPRQCDLALEIFDILGRKIESIEKSNQSAGLGQIIWDASSEPSGVYFYRLSAGNEQKTGRMVLLK